MKRIVFSLAAGVFASAAHAGSSHFPNQPLIVDASGKVVGIPLQEGYVMRAGRNGWMSVGFSARGFFNTGYTPGTYHLTKDCSGPAYTYANGDLPIRAFFKADASQPNAAFVTNGEIYYADGKPSLLTMNSIRQSDGSCTPAPITDVFAAAGVERVTGYVGPFTVQ